MTAIVAELKLNEPTPTEGIAALPATGDRLPVPASVWAVLAGLRFFLATVVAFTHICALCYPQWEWLARYPWAAFGGYDAVLGFFIISGFSIGASIERSPSGFYARRFWRIAPVYWACFIYAQVPWWVAHKDTIQFPNGQPLQSILTEHHGHMIYLANILCVQGLTTVAGSGFGQAWTLSCELVYYIAAPLLVRLRTRWVVAVAGLSVLSYVYHGWNFPVGYAQDDHGWPMICLAWAWIAGFLLYRHRGSLRAWALTAVGFLTLAGSDPSNRSVYGLVTCSIVLFAFWPGFVVQHIEAHLTPRLRAVLLWLGEISYPLYLSHFATVLLLGLVIHKAAQLKADGDYLFYAACMAAATVIYYAIDLPSRRLARLLKGRRAVTTSGTDT